MPLAPGSSLRVGDANRPRAAQLLRESPVEGLSGTIRFDWDSMDVLFEEDERVFVHPRSPYVRVDAVNRKRTYVHVDGVAGPLVASRSERAILGDLQRAPSEEKPKQPRRSLLRRGTHRPAVRSS
jgi:hypothetical protein